MPSVEAEPEPEPIPSVKDLASSEPALRRSSLNTILTHLTNRSSHAPLSSTQCLQLWRGFSVALYMHDSKNAVSVQNLIQTLASTLTTVYEKDLEFRSQQPSSQQEGESDEASSAGQWPWLTTWTTAFWETLCREWSGIDQWRMNKYLLLVRFVVRETFSILASQLAESKKSEDGDEETLSPETETGNKDTQSLVESQLNVFRVWPLSPRERKVPDGLRLHVLDIWLDELNKLSSNSDADESALQVLKAQLMQPIRDLAKEALSKSVRTRAKDVIKTFDSEGS